MLPIVKEVVMGFSSHAAKVIKTNRAMLQKRKTFKEVKEMFLDSTNPTQLEFIEVSPQKLAKIKAEIRRKAKADAWKEAGVYIICTSLVLYFLYWVLYI